MNVRRKENNILINIEFMFVMLILSLLSLISFTFIGTFAPLLCFALMLVLGSVLIVVFSKNELSTKIKLFIFFFSLYFLYTLVVHHILLDDLEGTMPYLFVDEQTLYDFSNRGIPYISGEKTFFDIFSVYSIDELPLHVVFSALIAYFSIAIDGNNTIMVQKLLSPFFGGMFSVVLYSTLKYQFVDRVFALNATIAYALLSVIFMYSTVMLRDIDIALAYMIFIYVFLQPNSYKSFFSLLLIAFVTVYLRVESGMVLFGLILVYSHLYVRNLESRSIKLIFYILLIGLFSFIVLLMSHKIISMIVGLDEANRARSVLLASKDSIALKFNKLPFPLSYIVKVLFGQIQPFPLFLALDRPVEAISGIFWPFIFIIMLYGVMKKNIRVLIDTKVKYLLIVAVAILFLMSSEPMARRMMSVYPIIYITSLYVFFVIPQNEIKRLLFYYLFAIISLNTFYYFIKL